IACEVGESCVGGNCINSSEPCQRGDPRCENCQSDANCGAGYLCHEGQCVSHLMPLGDPCEIDEACEGKVCTEDGYCTGGCATDTDCGVGGTCDKGTNRCSLDERMPIGGPCSYSTDCLANKCIEGLTDEPVCTRPCSTDGF